MALETPMPKQCCTTLTYQSILPFLVEPMGMGTVFPWGQPQHRAGRSSMDKTGIPSD